MIIIVCALQFSRILHNKIMTLFAVSFYCSGQAYSLGDNHYLSVLNTNALKARTIWQQP